MPRRRSSSRAKDRAQDCAKDCQTSALRPKKTALPHEKTCALLDCSVPELSTAALDRILATAERLHGRADSRTDRRTDGRADSRPGSFPLPQAPALQRPRPFWGIAPKARTDSGSAATCPVAASATAARDAITAAASRLADASARLRLSASAAAAWHARFLSAGREWHYQPADLRGQSPLPAEDCRTGQFRLLSLQP